MAKPESFGHLQYYEPEPEPEPHRTDAEVFKRMKAVGAEVKARAALKAVVERLSEDDKRL